MNSKRRIDKLEQQLPPEPENEYTIHDFAGDVLEAIADGHICDWSDKAHDRDFDYSSLLSPTVGDGLDDDTRVAAWSLLHEAQRTVAEIARFTSWRSPLADDNRAWTGFRANSTAELRALMAEIMNYAD